MEEYCNGIQQFLFFAKEYTGGEPLYVSEFYDCLKSFCDKELNLDGDYFPYVENLLKQCEDL